MEVVQTSHYYSWVELATDWWNVEGSWVLYALFKLEPDIELYSLRELALNPADIFLENLTVPNLLLHLTRLTRISATGSRIITLLL